MVTLAHVKVHPWVIYFISDSGYLIALFIHSDRYFLGRKMFYFHCSKRWQIAYCIVHMAIYPPKSPQSSLIILCSLFPEGSDRKNSIFGCKSPFLTFPHCIFFAFFYVLAHPWEEKRPILSLSKRTQGLSYPSTSTNRMRCILKRSLKFYTSYYSN